MRKFLSYLVVLLSVCVAMVLFFNSSSCLAYSFDEFIDFCTIVKDLPEANTTQKNLANFIINHKQNYINKFGSSINCTSWVAGFGNNSQYGDQYQVIGWKGGTAVNLNNFGGGSFITNNTYFYKVFYTSRGGAFYGDASNYYTNGFILVDNSLANGVDWGNRIANNYYSTFDMSFTHGYSEDLNFNNEVVQAVKLNYNNTRVFIETVSGYEEATNIKAKLDNFDLDFVDYAGTGQIAKYQLLSRLNYNQPYNLVVSCIYDGEPQQISETIVFIPDGTIIENGSITYYPSGDVFNTQNATNTILNYLNSSGDVEGQFDDIFSGDSMTIANNLSFPNIPYTNYWMPIYNFAVGICDTLQASGDVYFDIPIRGTSEVKRVYASSFTTPDSPLFQFVSATLVFGVVFELYVQFKDFIYFLNTANFHEAIKQLDSEENQLWRM